MKWIKYMAFVVVPQLCGAVTLALLASWGTVNRPRNFMDWSTHAVPAWILILVWALAATVFCVVIEKDKDDWGDGFPLALAIGCALGVVAAFFVTIEARDVADQSIKETELSGQIGYPTEENKKNNTVVIEVQPECKVEFKFYPSHTPPQLLREEDDRIYLYEVGQPLDASAHCE